MFELNDADTCTMDVDAGRADELLRGGALDRLGTVFRHHAAQCKGGMQFSVYRAGEPVARLRAGVAGKRADTSARAWDERTLAVFFSGTKGLVATIAAKAAGEGLLDVDAPVADYWPEFARAGKDTVTVAQVLSHTVGLPFVDPDPSLDAEDRPRADDERWAFLDSRRMADILAQQAPLWEPGTKIAYHAITYGYLMSEIILRATGRSVAQWMHADLAQPYDLDLHLGLPAEDEDRVAPIFQAPGYSISTYLKDDPRRRSVIDRMYASLLAPSLPMNSRAFHVAEVSAGGGMGSADAMAKLYSLVVTPGRLGGGIVATEAMEQALRTRSEGLDVLNDRPLRFGLGFELADPIGTYGPVEHAFGHSGAGGSLHGAWIDEGLGFSFLSNEMLTEDVDRRAKDLLDALAGS
ncbi:serine hydrolase domain-containing protein [Brevibacterium marinum]|uniref:CubicO group peptidase (Beta-lactamase class C family) n=1 Tax=Brevibacterium marinum TaxID=418643 RepID=A0A846RZ70_9MICO|nr:serine hydrolase domain-containing protein [Brevibacterium marinum]NJC56470.1 CubicO group peptidase (beta-lactamase class C family) [Brevibacterium marinum]